MIARAQAAFRRDLPELLQTHYRKWIAYHGDRPIKVADSKADLHEHCLDRGFKPEEFLVRSIEPEADDEIDAFLDV